MTKGSRQRRGRWIPAVMAATALPETLCRAEHVQVAPLGATINTIHLLKNSYKDGTKSGSDVSRFEHKFSFTKKFGFKEQCQTKFRIFYFSHEHFCRRVKINFAKQHLLRTCNIFFNMKR